MEGMLQEVFLKLLNMSLTAGWLILAVVVIRFIFRNQMKGFRCVLWGLVALRLIFPFSIESITSLIPSAEVVPPEIIMDKTPAIESGIGVVDMVINPLIAGNFSPAPGDSVNPLQVVSFVAAVASCSSERTGAEIFAVEMPGNAVQWEKCISDGA